MKQNSNNNKNNSSFSYAQFEDEESQQPKSLNNKSIHQQSNKNNMLLMNQSQQNIANQQNKNKANDDYENEECSRQDVSFEIYSNEDERKQIIEDEKEKIKQQQDEERQQRISKIVSFVFGVLPIFIMIGIFLLFSFDDDIKKRVVNMFQNIHTLNFEISFYLLLYGMLLIFLSFPYLIFEMSLGFTFSFPVATFFAVTAKLLGEILCFTLSRYVFKNCCLKFLRMNEYFIVLERAVKKYPWLVSNLLRASILVPLFVVNFGSGIIDLTLTQYLVPAFLWGAVYSMFMVICGSQLMNIKEVLENATFPKNRLLFFFELGMLIVSLLLMIAIIWKSGKMYESIKAEMQEQMILEKQLQSTKAQDSFTVINGKNNINSNNNNNKQNSADFIPSLDVVEQSADSNKQNQSIKKQIIANNSFNAFQIDSNNNKQNNNSNNIDKIQITYQSGLRKI